MHSSAVHRYTTLRKQHCQPSGVTNERRYEIDRTCVEIVAGPRAVEPVPEEVREDLAGEALRRAPLVLDVRPQRRVLGQAGDLRERVADREEDAVDLRVLVCMNRKSSASDKTGIGTGGSETGGHSPMNMSAFGTLWSPMWMTDEPTQEPMLLCARLRIACIMRDVFGAACTRLRPWPVSRRR